jgi:hypothetical protein
VSSVAVLLEERDVGNGDSYGPSGKDWAFIGAATLSRFPICNGAGVAPTCYAEGQVTQSAGATATFAPSPLLSVGPTPGGECPDPSDAGTHFERAGFSVEFDLAALGLSAGADARANVVVTFDPARGGKSSCALDEDCDAATDATDSRSIQVRHRFPVPDCS